AVAVQGVVTQARHHGQRAAERLPVRGPAPIAAAIVVVQVDDAAGTGGGRGLRTLRNRLELLDDAVAVVSHEAQALAFAQRLLVDDTALALLQALAGVELERRSRGLPGIRM